MKSSVLVIICKEYFFLLLVRFRFEMCHKYMPQSNTALLSSSDLLQTATGEAAQTASSLDRSSLDHSSLDLEQPRPQQPRPRAA